MNAASTDPSHTMTVAATQVHDAADRQAVGERHGDYERHEGRDQGDTPEHRPGAPPQDAEEKGLEQGEDDREDCDRHDETRHVQAHSVQDRCGDDQPDRVPRQRDSRRTTSRITGLCRQTPRGCAVRSRT